MGANQSHVGGVDYGNHKDASLNTDRGSRDGPVPNDVFELWPALEKQLETSFRSLDIDATGLLPYETLEPVLRHHLMQAGLLEYVTRFADPVTGELNSSTVADALPHYGINLEELLDEVDWKNLCICWIRAIQSAEESDIIRWQRSRQEMQEEQAKKYQEAMKRFQEQYVEQLESCYRAVEAAHAREDEYRKNWEKSLELQEEFHSSGTKFFDDKNAESTELFNKKINEQPDVAQELLSQLDLGRKPTCLEGSVITTVRYAYPASVTTTGAPVSGGAQMPARRRRMNHRRKPMAALC